MAVATRCKFRVTKVELYPSNAGHYEDGNWVDDGPFIQPTVHLTAVKDEDPQSENGKFWAASPAGAINLTINNPAGAEVFEPGGWYYVDFTRAEKDGPA